MKKSFILITTVWAVLTGCKNETLEECAFVAETSAISIQLNWESLEDSLPAITSKKELIDFFTRHAELRDVFFNRPSYPSDSVFINELYHRFMHPSIDILLQDTHQLFGDLTELKHQFETAFANFKYYYPEFQPPKIQTVITGLERDLFVSDSLIIIGLDHFMGPGARYEPNMYDYMKKRYHKDFIVPSVMLLYGIDNRYNKVNPADRTVLGDMIAYGKAYYFSKLMTPCTPDSVLIGYSGEEMAGAWGNEDLIWSRLIEDQILFSTSHQDKQKYISERPRTLEVGEKCPGRIGTWVGWQIVKQYHIQYPERSLPEIMNMDNAEALFKASGYKPQIVKVPQRQKI